MEASDFLKLKPCTVALLARVYNEQVSSASFPSQVLFARESCVRQDKFSLTTMLAVSSDVMHNSLSNFPCWP